MYFSSEFWRVDWKFYIESLNLSHSIKNFYFLIKEFSYSLVRFYPTSTFILKSTIYFDTEKLSLKIIYSCIFYNNYLY